jgi:hypothetical protein
MDKPAEVTGAVNRETLINSIEDTEMKSADQEYQSAMGRAISYWHRGLGIPRSLHMQLVEEGYDPHQLAAFHLRK